MKSFLLCLLLICSGCLHAQSLQPYIAPDAARQLILTAKTPEQKFFGYYSLDRYYYTTGLYDSSRNTQLEMYNIAEALDGDSLLASTYFAIGNMLTHKSDYNFSLSSYFKALEYAKDDFRKARIYASAGYVYLLTGNYDMGYKYLRKADSISSSPGIKQ